MGGITGRYNASLGYRVTCNGEKGFITAGHAISLGYAAEDSYGEEIGTCDLYDYYNGGTVDAAFVKIDDPAILNILSNNIGATSMILSTDVVDSSSLVYGLTVVKVGAVTGFSETIINSTNVSFTDTETHKTVTKQISLATSSSAGDSGGIVALHNTNDYRTLGIIKGAATNGTTVCTLASEIKKRFYCERY